MERLFTLLPIKGDDHEPIQVPAVGTAVLAACGGGGDGTPAASTETAGCEPGNPATANECGTLLLGLTDADGDFLSYTADVVSLTLTKSSGATVEVLPAGTRVDFANYVEELADRNPLVIARGRPSLLTVDFDLAASHRVDIAPTPAMATAEPFILAEIDPVDARHIRLRGAFIEADVDALHYTIALRPFWDRGGDFGRVAVNVTYNIMSIDDSLVAQGNEDQEQNDGREDVADVDPEDAFVPDVENDLPETLQRSQSV